VVSKTLDPEFNEVLELQGTLGELVSHGLLFKVFDKDRVTRNDLLGEVHVSLDALRVSRSKDFVESLSTQGSLTFSVEWESVSSVMLASGSLHVHLSHATNLKAMDSNGFSDPYVKLALRGQTHKSKTIRKTLNPRWDEQFEFKGVLGELLEQPMQLHAFDYDFGKRDDKLGNASIDLRVFERARQHDFAVALSDNGGTVNLRMTWVPVGGVARDLALPGPRPSQPAPRPESFVAPEVARPPAVQVASPSPPKQPAGRERAAGVVSEPQAAAFLPPPPQQGGKAPQRLQMPPHPQQPPPQQQYRKPQAGGSSSDESPMTDRERQILQRQQALLQQKQNPGIAAAANIAAQQQQQQRRPQAQPLGSPPPGVKMPPPPPPNPALISRSPAQPTGPPNVPKLSQQGQALGVTIKGGPQGGGGKKKKGLFS